MFETWKFSAYSGMMLGIAKRAKEAHENGDEQSALLFLKNSLLWGYKALHIRSEKISAERREGVAEIVSSFAKTYQSVFITQRSEDDRELVLSAVKTWHTQKI